MLLDGIRDLFLQRLIRSFTSVRLKVEQNQLVAGIA
jgi:hypothetical protein